MSLADKRRNLMEKLSARQVKPEKCGEDGIGFKDGQTFFIIYLHENDNSYYRLFLPRFYKVKDGEQNKISKIMNEMNIKYRMAKVICMDSVLCISLETIFDSEKAFLDNLKYFIDLSKKCGQETLKRIQEE